MPPKGCHLSEETKKKMGDACRGKKRAPFSEEWKKKIGESGKGRHPTEETRKKLSNAKKGIHPTEETRKKMSESKKGKISNMLGKHHSAESIKKYIESRKGKYCGKDSPLYGTHPSQETLIKMSESRKGELTWCYGKHLSEEHRRNIGEGNKGRIQSEETKLKISNANKGKHHTEETKQKLRLSHLKRVITTKDTSIEKILQNKLINKGILFKTHLSTCNICQPDIVFPEQKVAIFADGDYWHSKTFNNGKQWEKDRKQETTLIESGWTVLRFWEKEINSNPNECINKIINIIGGV